MKQDEYSRTKQVHTFVISNLLHLSDTYDTIQGQYQKLYYNIAIDNYYMLFCFFLLGTRLCMAHGRIR